MSTKKRPVPLEHFLYTGNSVKTINELFLLIDSNSMYLTKNYTLAIETKKNREKGTAHNYGAKGSGRQAPNPAQVDKPSFIFV